MTVLQHTQTHTHTNTHTRTHRCDGRVGADAGRVEPEAGAELLGGALCVATPPTLVLLLHCETLPTAARHG